MRRLAWLLPAPVCGAIVALMGVDVTASWQVIVSSLVFWMSGALTMELARWTKEA